MRRPSFSRVDMIKEEGCEVAGQDKLESIDRTSDERFYSNEEFISVTDE